MELLKKLQEKLNYKPQNNVPDSIKTVRQVKYDIDYESIRNYINQRLATAIIKKKPFPYLQLDHLLPDDYYDLLLDALPLPQDVGSDNTGALNFAISKFDKNFTKMTPERMQLWIDFESKVNQPIIRSGLIKLFSRYTSLKCDMMLDKQWPSRAEAVLGTDWKKHFDAGDVFGAEGSSGGRILLATRNFGLRPHVDNASSLLTYLFYMPRDNSHESAGTKVHEVKDPKSVCEKYRAIKKINVWFPEPNELTNKDFIFPFSRNSVAAMLCLPTSVHSAELQDLNFCRYAIQTQVFFRNDVGDALFKGWTHEGSSY